jgi:DNA-binding GntR family transcriptional regulator
MISQSSIVAQVLELIVQERMPLGSHLAAQTLADRLRVSRSPVNDALSALHEKGVLSRELNRGYFLAKSVADIAGDPAEKLGLAEPDRVTEIYFRLADELLRGLLPHTCTQALLKARYGLAPAQLHALLARISNEGWAARKPGYGWEFSTMLTTPDSLLQSYRLRLALEPAALLEPTFHIDPRTIERCRAAEHHLLNGGIETDTADQLHERGVRFHESLVEASGNPFFIDTIKRVNRVRRLLSYRSMKDRSRYREHCEQHLHVLELLSRERNDEASVALHDHLRSTLRNLAEIGPILAP